MIKGMGDYTPDELDRIFARQKIEMANKIANISQPFHAFEEDK
jgi:hypothetical protein